jgi:hypothetical protein
MAAEEAADLMNMSLAYIQGLLERSELPSPRADDVAAIGEVLRVGRLDAVNDLAREAQAARYLLTMT